MLHAIILIIAEHPTPRLLALPPAPPGQLTLDSLGDLLEAIYSASSKWYNLGLRLGLQASVLDAITARCMQDPEVCLREMLKEWLKLGDPTPTWRELLKALKSRAVGEAALAKRLKAEHCQPEQQVEAGGGF